MKIPFTYPRYSLRAVLFETGTSVQRCGSIFLTLLVGAVAGCDFRAEPENVTTEVVAEVVPVEGSGHKFHVAPDGRDENPGTAEEPFATLERARDAVREVLPKMSEDIVVEVAPGNYFRTEPFVLGPEDSGRDEHRVIYRGTGEPGSARLIGGQRITGWKPLGGGAFRVKLPPGVVAHTLYENGSRAWRARFPNYKFDARFPLSAAPYLTTVSGTTNSFIWKEGALEPIKDVVLNNGANVVLWPWGYADWHKTPRRIEGIDHAKRQIEVEELKTNIGKQARFFIEGALELLDAPGEFYFDPATSELTYWPRFGMPDEVEIIVPMVKSIVSLEGASVDDPVTHVTIEGFTMACTDTFAAMEGTTMFPWSETSVGPHGIIQLRYTADVEIRNNHLRGSGMNGIYFERSNKRDLIFGNWIEDSGISGIVLAYHRQMRQLPKDINEDNVIENNLIEGMGSVAVDSAGINIWGGLRNTVRNCVIMNGARYGISMRGPYTQLRPGDDKADMKNTNRPLAEHNLITHTRMARLAQDSGDTAALHLAGISSRSHHPVNTMEQLIIEDIAAHPSMKDCPPNGIFFDYTEGVTDQVLRNIEILETPNPFRTNRTDIRHTYDNVSWKDDFDASRMDRDKIGLLKDFPANYGRPAEVAAPKVTETEVDGVRKLNVEWTAPEDSDLAGVWVTAFGEPEIAPIFVAAAEDAVTLSKPVADRLVMLLLQTQNDFGTRSDGILIPAAEEPSAVGNVVATGRAGAVEVSWTSPDDEIAGFRVVADAPGIDPVDVTVGETKAVISGLTDGKSVAVRVDVVDRDGQVWTGQEIKTAAGEGVPVPTDVAAWWTFDETQLTEGQSIGDESGNGNTLFVTGNGVEPTEGRVGGGFKLNEGTGSLRLLDGTKLAMGTGDYAVSLWIKRTPSTAMSGRIFDFGAGSRGEWEHWGQPATNSPGGGLLISSGDNGVSAMLNDGTRTYNLKADGLSLCDQWHHVVVNVSRDQMVTLWVNGERSDSVRVTESKNRDIQPAETLFIGKSGMMDHANLNWAGVVDQLRVYRRALNNDEIAALYLEGGSAGQ
ncbi:MAG: LamG-like jellyroll fold domain-containing protein [Terrimicrobiaceae bacterium]